MKKQELLASLTAMPFVGPDGIMDAPVNLNSPEANGAQRYEVSIFETAGNVAASRKVQFYVLHEGKENEVAYWFNSAPVQTIASGV